MDAKPPTRPSRAARKAPRPAAHPGRTRQAPWWTPIAAVLAAAVVLSQALPASSQEASATVANVAPAVTGVAIAGLTAGSLTPTPGGTSSVTVTATVSDDNGFGDIAQVTIGLLRPDGTVHIAQAAAAFVSGSGATATYTRTLTLNFHDPAALGASQYQVRVVATDAAGATGSNTPAASAFNYAELVALSPVGNVSLGTTLRPGVAGTPVAITVQNLGNVRTDLQLALADLRSSLDTIPAGSVAYSLDPGMAGAAPLSNAATTLTATDLAPGAASSRTVYLQLTPPVGTLAGTYTGAITVGAVAG